MINAFDLIINDSASMNNDSALLIITSKTLLITASENIYMRIFTFPVLWEK